MKKTARRVCDLGELSAAERKVLAELDAGDDIELGDGKVPRAEDGGRRVRAELIRLLLLGDDPDPKYRLHEKGLRIVGAWIPDRLDLEGCRIPCDIALIRCLFDVTPMLRSASVDNLFLNRSVLPGLNADRLEARGGVFLRGIEATGLVRLVGAKLGGELDCARATLQAAKGRKGYPGAALDASFLKAKGSVFLVRAEVSGDVRLIGAKLGGDLSCYAATFRAEKDARGKPGSALCADGATVGGTLFLLGGTNVIGTASLTGAEVNDLNDEIGSWPGRGDLVLDRFRYGAFTGGHVDARSRLDWLDRQDATRWGADFWPQPYEQCAKVLREMGHGGEARKVLIEKERLQRAARRAGFMAQLDGARLRAQVEAHGMNAVAPEIRAALDAYSERDPRREALLTELRKSPEVRRGLATRELGHDAVGSRAERISAARAPVWDYWWKLHKARVWDGLVVVTIGYGRAPERAAIWAAGFLLFGWFMFALAGGHGAIKPNNPVVLRAEEWVECAPGGDRNAGNGQVACFIVQPEARSYPRFNALIYFADTLLPIVSLEMQGFWIPDESTPRGQVARVYLWVHIAVGWAAGRGVAL